MKKNPLQRLSEMGQSVWLDYLSRSLITSGKLKALIAEDALRGMTSNPSIFEKSIDGSNDYDGEIRAMAQAGRSVPEIYQALTVRDVQMAADVFRPVYDRLNGADGYVSLEVNPHLARDTEGTVKEARRLWAAVGRPNIFIKIPATREGLPAITQCLSEGININVTLLFGLPRYREVAEAHLSGIEKLIQQGGKAERVASVASFFLSRIDVLVDPLLKEQMKARGPKAELARRLRGQAAIASARLAYQIYKEIVGSNPLFQDRAGRGAAAARSVGKHQHQRSRIQRREIRGGAHRPQHGQYRSHGDPGGLPRSRRSRTPSRARPRSGPRGDGEIARPRNRR